MGYMDNYPPGMSRRDLDWVEGIVRCDECDHPAGDEDYCDNCHKCSHCCIGDVAFHEPTDKYLCETCADREDG